MSDKKVILQDADGNNLFPEAGSIKEGTDIGVADLQAETATIQDLQVGNLKVVGSPFETLATFTISGENIEQPASSGALYKFGNIYFLDCKGITINVSAQLTEGAFYTLMLTAVTGELPNITPWAPGSAATNIGPVSIEATLMTTASIRIKPVGGGVSTAGYIRLGCFVFSA